VTFFSFFAKAKVSGMNTTWVNDEDHKIPIIDGRISFYDENTGARFELMVTQVKGHGTADADHLKKLSDHHKLIVTTMINNSEFHNLWSTDEILLSVKFKLPTQEQRIFKPNNWRRPISELLRKGIIYQVGSNSPPFYSLNYPIARKALETGNFE